MESILRKMVRISGPIITVTLGLLLTRSMSWTGTGSIMSMSPDSSAATRVAADLMDWKITSSRLCSGLPHQPGDGLNTGVKADSGLTVAEGLVAFGLQADGDSL